MFKFSKKKLKYKCPCCGYYTYNEKPNGQCDICPVCYWKDDPFQSEDPDKESGANGVSLNQARENFKKFGACQENMIKYMRSSNEDELTGLDY